MRELNSSGSGPEIPPPSQVGQTEKATNDSVSPELSEEEAMEIQRKKECEVVKKKKKHKSDICKE
jgi:hypothetical protein